MNAWHSITFAAGVSAGIRYRPRDPQRSIRGKAFSRVTRRQAANVFAPARLRG